MKKPTTEELAVAAIRAIRVLDRTSLQVLAQNGAGAKLFTMLHPYMDEALNNALGIPDTAFTRTEVEEYFVVQRKMLDADFAKLHAEEDRLRATQRETRALIKAALVFKKATEKIVDSGVLAYWGNPK